MLRYVYVVKKVTGNGMSVAGIYAAKAYAIARAIRVAHANPDAHIHVDRYRLNSIEAEPVAIYDSILTHDIGGEG